MRRIVRRAAGVMAVLCLGLVATTATASAQNFDEVLAELEERGYYIEPGGEGSDARFAELVRIGDRTDDTWYFVSMADTVSEGFADDLFDELNPRGNVLVYFLDGDFVQAQLATNASESIEDRALEPFEGDWDQPEDFMEDVVARYESLTASSGSGSSASSGSDSGGGFPWGLLAIPAALGGGIWFLSSRSKKKKAAETLERAQKIRAELQAEIDELANDVLVLSGPVDLSANEKAIDFYREATDTYLTIADEIPDLGELEAASLTQLRDIGTRVTHARWQMDAAEALLDGEPIPEKPKVEPPPAPPKPAQDRTQHREYQREQQRRRMPQRQPRQRVPYSRSRRSSGGGGLLDILIAGGAMMGRSRGGGMFGGRSRTGTSGRSSSGSTRTPRSGGGVFGTGSRSSGRSSSSRSSSGRSSSGRSSSSRSRSRRTRSGGSTSKRRRR